LLAVPVGVDPWPRLARYLVVVVVWIVILTEAWR